MTDKYTGLKSTLKYECIMDQELQTSDSGQLSDAASGDAACALSRWQHFSA